MAKDGFNIPPFDIDDTLSKLENIIKFFSPKKVITLGDNFHEKDSLKKIHKDSLFKINLLTKNITFFDTGNHDQFLRGKIYSENHILSIKLTGMNLGILKQPKRKTIPLNFLALSS